MKLLLISCSATKRQGELTLPAIERYDGPKFRVLRKALAGDIEPLTVRILSAAKGMIGPEFPLEHYDMELTPKSRDRLVMSPAHRAGFAALVAAHDDVFVMAGGLYLTVLDAWHPGRPAWRVATGAPGQRLNQLKTWLHQGGTP